LAGPAAWMRARLRYRVRDEGMAPAGAIRRPRRPLTSSGREAGMREVSSPPPLRSPPAIHWPWPTTGSLRAAAPSCPRAVVEVSPSIRNQPHHTLADAEVSEANVPQKTRSGTYSVGIAPERPAAFQPRQRERNRVAPQAASLRRTTRTAPPPLIHTRSTYANIPP